MEIYEYETYRDFLQSWLRLQPKSGRGLMQKMASQLRISSVLMSQIMGGSRILQPDYAFGIANFIGLTANETEYFLLLVQFENAATEDYKKFLKKRIRSLLVNAGEIKNRVSKDIRLSEETKARFYSHWHYSAIRLLTDIPGFDSTSEIAKALSLEPSYVAEILDFLVANKLCSNDAGKHSMSVQSTHLESSSPWILSRQLQWRQKAIQKMDVQKPKDLFYTGPMVLSDVDATWIHEKCLQFIREATERARKSKSAKLMCLNLDWFEVIGSKSS